ncbi:MAG: hypothetical protein ABI761_04395 [Saprospiraceae bacterium]
MNPKKSNPDKIEIEEINMVADGLSIPKYHAARILKKTTKVFGHTCSIEETLNLRKQLPIIIKIILEEVKQSEKSILINKPPMEDNYDIINNRIQIKECGFSIKSFF